MSCHLLTLEPPPLRHTHTNAAFIWHLDELRQKMRRLLHSLRAWVYHSMRLLLKPTTSIWILSQSFLMRIYGTLVGYAYMIHAVLCVCALLFCCCVCLSTANLIPKHECHFCAANGPFAFAEAFMWQVTASSRDKPLSRYR